MNSIGLPQQEAKEIANSLNDLLANYQIFYMNTRGFHWNIKGKSFFELHAKFEELYNDLLIKVDEIAERILTLNITPTHAYSDYLKSVEIKEVKNYFKADDIVKSILSGLQVLLNKQRAILELSSEISDEGTSSMMGDYIKEQEKLVWMYSAYLQE